MSPSKPKSAGDKDRPVQRKPFPLLVETVPRPEESTPHTKIFPVFFHSFVMVTVKHTALNTLGKCSTAEPQAEPASKVLMVDLAES